MKLKLKLKYELNFETFITCYLHFQLIFGGKFAMQVKNNTHRHSYFDLTPILSIFSRVKRATVLPKNTFSLVCKASALAGVSVLHI